MRFSLGMVMMVLVATIGAESACAQRVDDLARGEKVRVLVHGGTHLRAYVDTVTSETISLHVFDQNPEGDRLQLQRNRVTQMQVLRKTKGKGVARGALLGMLIGGGSAFIIGAATYSGGDCMPACSASSSGAFASIWGAVIGIPAGMMWGASRQEWKDVALRPR